MPKEQGEGAVAIWTRRLGQQAMPMFITQPPAKIGLWGDTVPIKNSAIEGTWLRTMASLVLPVDIRKNTQNKMDAWIAKYNDENPENNWWPTTPLKFVTINRKRYDLTEQEYHDVIVQSGQKTLEWAEKRKWYDRPATENNLRALQNTLEMFRGAAKARIIGQKALK
jgi:hypothetical protein